jgi:hypothetical protein
MLRYVFENATQLKNHLHVDDGHALLFFPNAGAPGLGGERVMLEVTLPGHGQHAVLRGTVRARVPQTGVWLDFPDAGLLRTLERDATTLTQRRDRRFGAELTVEVRAPGDVRTLGKVLDLSAGGARIAGCRLAPGTVVEVRPLTGVSREPARARVVRCTAHDLAVEFWSNDAQTRATVRSLLDGMHERWDRAPTLSHPPSCCAGNGVVEPPLPRVRPRH